MPTGLVNADRFYFDELSSDLQYHVLGFLGVPDMVVLTETSRTTNERSAEAINTRFGGKTDFNLRHSVSRKTNNLSNFLNVVKLRNIF